MIGVNLVTAQVFGLDCNAGLEMRCFLFHCTLICGDQGNDKVSFLNPACQVLQLKIICKIKDLGMDWYIE